MLKIAFAAARGPRCALLFHFYSPTAAIPISFCPDDPGSRWPIDESSRGSLTWSCVFPVALRPSFPQMIPKLVPSVCSWNRPVVTSPTAVPTLTQRAGHPERNPGASRVPAIAGFPCQWRDGRNVSTLIYAFPRARYAGTLAVALHKGSKKFSRDFPGRGQPVAFHGTGRMRHRSKTRNVSSQKHKSGPGRFLVPENAVFTPVTD